MQEMKILFLCKSNIQRSQWAEAFFADLSDKHEISSAGLQVRSKWEGVKIGDISVVGTNCMKEIGFDLTNKVCTKLTEEMLSDFDLVIALEKNFWPEYLKLSDKVRLWDLEDPGSQDIEIRRKIRDQIRDLVKRLVRELD